MFAISISAFVMSLLSWVHVWVYQRRKLSIRIVNYLPLRNEHNFFLSFENESRLPVLVTRIWLLSDCGKRLECLVTPSTIFEITRTKGEKEMSRESIKNLQMPLAISGLGGLSGWITFVDPHKTLVPLSTVANFQVHTNRGGPFRMTLPLVRGHLDHHMF